MTTVRPEHYVRSATLDLPRLCALKAVEGPGTCSLHDGATGIKLTEENL